MKIRMEMEIKKKKKLKIEIEDISNSKKTKCETILKNKKIQLWKRKFLRELYKIEKNKIKIEENNRMKIEDNNQMKIELCQWKNLLWNVFAEHQEPSCPRISNQIHLHRISFQI